MRAFERFALLYIGLSFLLKKTSTKEDGFVLFKDIYKAVLDSYDINAPFDENIDIILRYFCPQRSASSCDDSQKNEVILPVATNTSLDVKDAARKFLQENAHYLNGCCTKCSCAKTCHINENCCYSNLTQKKPDISHLKHIRSRCVATNIKAHLARYSTTLFPNSYSMVTHCLNETIDVDVTNRCLKPNVTIPIEVVPVVSNTTKVIYWNRFCAQCNDDDDDIEPWNTHITFHSQDIMFAFKDAESMSILFQAGLSKLVNIEFIPPTHFNLSYDDYGCKPEAHVIYTQCNASGLQINTYKDDDQIIDRACSSVKSTYFSSIGRQHPNVFCYLCNKNTINFTSHKTCKRNTIRSYNGAVTGYLHLIDGNQKANQIVANRMSNPCTCREVFDQKQTQCRKIYCPYMERYVGCSCVKIVDSLYGFRTKVFLEMRPLSNGGLPKKWKKASDKDVVKLNKALSKRLRQIGTFTMQQYAVFQGKDRSGDFFYFASLIIPKIGFDSFAVSSDIYTRLMSGISLSVEGATYEITIGQFRIQRQPTTDKLSPKKDDVSITKRLFTAKDGYTLTAFSKIEILSPLLFCKQILLSDEESEVFTNSTDLTGTKLTGKVGNTYFIYYEDGVKICLEDFDELFQESTNNGDTFHNVWKVYLLVNVLCLLV